jgi:hypothetical protein
MNTIESGFPVYGGTVGVTVTVGESVIVGVGGGPNLMNGEAVGFGGVEAAIFRASEKLHAEMEKNSKKRSICFSSFTASMLGHIIFSTCISL